ncbi:MAG: hypothetical protein IIC51_09700, partial [Planctomycetes bacterium]|nr:hypothetical protein [Planctomycetota bacterium]
MKARTTRRDRKYNKWGDLKDSHRLEERPAPQRRHDGSPRKMQYVGRRNTIACTLLLLPIAGWGCKAGSPVIDRTVGSAADSSSSDVDPARAYVALADILPTATPPIRPESFTPLSERSARQIATS